MLDQGTWHHATLHRWGPGATALQTLNPRPPFRPTSSESLWAELENQHFYQVSPRIHMLIQVRTTGIVVNMSSTVQIPIPPHPH